MLLGGLMETHLGYVGRGRTHLQSQGRERGMRGQQWDIEGEQSGDKDKDNPAP